MDFFRECRSISPDGMNEQIRAFNQNRKAPAFPEAMAKTGVSKAYAHSFHTITEIPIFTIIMLVSALI